MNYSYVYLKLGYLNLWDRAQVHTDRQGELNYIIENKFLINKKRYQAVESVLQVPWYLVAALHYREADCDCNSHLHNGDPLSGRTYHVPAGRPPTGNPPFTWEESATDALHYDGLDQCKDWCISSILWNAEKFNGFGYFEQDINSPYIWAGTDQYDSGKYTEDGEYDPDAIDSQLGVASILKWLEHKQIIKLIEG
jgi:lysozyme family protein